MKGRLRHCLMLSCFLITLLSARGQGVDPYLQAITPTSIIVNWKTSAPVAMPLVRYGLSASALDLLSISTTQSMNDVGYSNNYFYHTTKLSGLQPATTYYYRAVSGNDSGNVCSFRTLPLPGALPNSSGHFRFLIMGDNQIKAEPRYDTLMVAAKRKMTELYGSHFNDSVQLIVMVGDQVDVGTLDHYENVHFKKSRYLSSVIPIQTTVGNHETYGTMQLQAYYNHIAVDSMGYKGIYSGTENYYAYQAGNVVFAHLSSEHTGAAQLNWLKKIVDSANIDPSVKWIITLSHRPYQAEQYVGDISPWVRDEAVPYAMLSPKYFLHIGAHHHLYARGQMKDAPAYNIISGGTAWNQYWGMATEQNFDDVQKTISNWAYQLVDVDMVHDKVDVTSYSIGSIYTRDAGIFIDNRVIDSFHRYKNLAAPVKPDITNVFPDSLQLPVTITGSPFSSPAGELLNSTDFQVALDRSFNVIEKTNYRHFEDLFGKVTGANPDTTTDQNLGINILEYTVAQGAIPNGKHYVRVRYRDRNESWSSWSDVDSFKVYNSVNVNPLIRLDTNRFAAGSTIHVAFSNGSASAAAWIGIYKKGQTPGSSTASVTWQYTNGANGTMNFTLTQSNEYFAAYFSGVGYAEIAPRVPFYYGAIPTLSIPASHYNVGQSIPVSFAGAPALNKDWIGLYKIGQTPGGPTSIKWSYTTANGQTPGTGNPNIAGGVFNVTNLPKGYYFASYFLLDAYTEATQRVYFSVGDTITKLTINKTIYDLGEYISASWIDGPGNAKDWLGIYPDTASNDNFVSYTYIEGRPAGSKNIADTSMPSVPGNYYIVLFTNDSYDEVSNRVTFQMMNGSVIPVRLTDFTGRAEGMSHLLEWKVEGEEPTDRYVLQRRINATDFADIYSTAAIPALHGNYSYLYGTPAKGANYYRLKMISADGVSKYSRIVKINQSNDRDAEQNIVNVYPNPVQQGSRSVIESAYPIRQIDILNASGQIIFQSKNINDNKFSLLHQDLPAGTYFVKIYSKEIYTAKLVVTH